MEQKRIRVTISPLGVSTIEAEGFTGQACAEVTKKIEQALAGSGGFEREFKDEWYQEESAEENVNQEVKW